MLLNADISCRVDCIFSLLQYIRKLITKMTPELFAELMNHMTQCATAYRRAAVLEARKEILLELFKNCDHASIGIIDRHRVLGLFKAFYDKQPWVTKRHIRNPRRCKCFF